MNDKLIDPLAHEVKTSRNRAIGRDQLRALQLENELSEARAELSQFREQYLRQRAEMENYSRAMEREKQQITANASRAVIKDLLPIIDSFESAAGSSKEDSNLTALRNQMVRILASYGFSAIEAKGKRFDPYLHEVIAVNQSKEDGIVLEEIQKGYKLNNEVIRTSKVIVGRKGD